MNIPTYLKAGNQSYALNLKAGSSSLVRAIISAHYPELETLITEQTMYPPGKGPDDIRWHFLLDQLNEPVGETVLIVREPVQKFLASCGERGFDSSEIEDVLDALESDELEDPHFAPQVAFARFGCFLYRFEDHLEEAALALGLRIPLPHIRFQTDKPTLSPEQLERVRTIYAADFELHASISEPGKIFRPEPAAPKEEELLALKIEQVTSAAMQAFTSLTLGKQALWEPLRVRIYDLIQLGDFESAIAILQSVPNLYEGMEEDRSLFISKLS